jgi:hypothetical protein
MSGGGEGSAGLLSYQYTQSFQHESGAVIMETQVVPPKKDLGLPKTMATNAVFVYTGAGGESAPDDVIRALVDPSVTTIPEDAFYKRKKLAEVELCEGLVEVRDFAFDDCGHSITKINIPNSLRRIGYAAFVSSLRTPIRLHDGIESIGESAFASCIFTNFRVPSLITAIPMCMLQGCTSMFSLEISGNVIEIRERFSILQLFLLTKCGISTQRCHRQ